MVSYIDPLYVTDKTKKRLPKIVKAISDNKLVYKGFVIILSQCDNDVFDIIPHFAIKGLNDKNIDIKVLGVAENKKAAMKLCALMSSEYIESGLNMSMRKYFENI